MQLVGQQLQRLAGSPHQCMYNAQAAGGSTAHPMPMAVGSGTPQSISFMRFRKYTSQSAGNGGGTPGSDEVRPGLISRVRGRRAWASCLPFVSISASRVPTCEQHIVVLIQLLQLGDVDAKEGGDHGVGVGVQVRECLQEEGAGKRLSSVNSEFKPWHIPFAPIGCNKPTFLSSASMLPVLLS